VGAEGFGNDSKLTQQEQMESRRDEQAGDVAAAAAAAAAADGGGKQGTMKDASKHSEGADHATWMPGWNLSSLTQLTGAVTNTVNCFSEVH